MQIDEQILLLFEGAMGFHCNREKKKKMPYMCFKKNIELNLNSFSTPSGSYPYPQPLRVHCRSSVPSLCLRSSFAPEGGQKATPKGLHSEATSTPKPACQSETDRYALQCNSSKNIPSIAKESHAFEGVMAFQVGQLLQVLFADYKSPLLSQGCKSQSTTFSFLIPS